MKPINRTTYKAVLAGALAILLMSLFFASIKRYFNIDEFEHIHSAWYVAKGFMPFADFFQHHHPLQWYLMAPIIAIFGQNTNTVMILRLLTFLAALGTIYLTYLIGRLCTDSRRLGVLSATILLSVVIFFEKVIEIRPDVPQVFFGLASVYYLLKFLKDNNNKQMVISGLMASISFLFLQKTGFLLIAYALLFGFLLLKKKISISPIVQFSAAFSAPVFIYLGYLILSGSFGDYFLTCWLVNLFTPREFSAFSYISLAQNLIFWLLAFISPVVLLSRKDTRLDLKIVAFLGFALLLSVFFVKLPYRQYFMFPIALLSIPVAYSISQLEGRFKLSYALQSLILIAIIIQPLFFISPFTTETNDRQIKVINYVLENSNEGDLIYDGIPRFNLFRRDLHYFWYNKRALKVYNKLTVGKFADYSPCKLVKEKKPKFATIFDLDVNKCGLETEYEETEFRGLFKLK